MSTKRDEESGSNTAALEPALLRLYNAYRTALLNVKYYGHKLRWANNINTSAEVLIAIAASSVSSWAVWSTKGGAPVWGTIAGLSAVLAAIKPALPLTKNISRYSHLHAGHYSNFLFLKDIVERVPIEGGLTRELQREFDTAAKRYREMASQDDPSPSKKLVARFQEEVNAQIPSTSLWCPQK